MNHYLAIDLGAESGRVILGTLSEGKLSMRELYRFSNGMLVLNNKCHWNIGQLYSEILKGLDICVNRENIQPSSIGIDTWGVDYGLLAQDGSLLGLPFAYRDSRTQNAIEEFTAIMPKQDIYRATGNLFAPYNTLFQLYAAKKYQPLVLSAAHDLLFIPDLLTYLLTGVKKTEYSFATTSQLYNPKAKCWEKSIFSALGISDDIMQDVVEPGSIIGNLSSQINKQTGIKEIPVVAVATHDTASAISAIPSSGGKWGFISSGTWSLMGIETDLPIISEETYKMNFTNEGGVENNNYLIKNIMGLWLLQQCLKLWKNEKYTYETLVNTSLSAQAFLSFIDIDSLKFLNPDNMCDAIIEYCKETRQKSPASHGQFVRVILESLALKYRYTLEQLGTISSIDEIIITGGGINNKLLCQFTANACGIPVKTALSESTAAGNIMIQALGLGHVKSLAGIREVIANSCRIVTYYPQETDRWNDGYVRYKKIVNNSYNNIDNE